MSRTRSKKRWDKIMRSKPKAMERLAKSVDTLIRKSKVYRPKS